MYYKYFYHLAVHCIHKTVLPDSKGTLSVYPLIQPCFPRKIKQSSCYRNTMRNLIERGVITLYEKCIPPYKSKEEARPAVFAVTDIKQLEKLAENDSEPIVKRKIVTSNETHFLSIINEYNQQSWIDPITFMTFDGGRATSFFTTLPSKDNIHKHKREYYKYREDYLDEFYGKANWYHYDVPSSIPQIIHLMNKGFWLDKRVWDMLNPEYKQYSMRLLFNDTDQKVAKALLNAFREDICKKYERKFFYTNVSENDELVQVAHSIKQQLETIIGPIDHFGKKNAELFIHESNIYLLVLKKLMNKGVKVMECYDSFYWNKDSGISEEQVAYMVKECAEEYYRNQNGLFASEKIRIKLQKLEEDKLIAEKHENRKKDRHCCQKVDKWLKRNPDSFDFPSKWNKEEIDFALKKISEKS